MATPPQRRPWIEAGSLARTIDPGLVLPADLSGMALIEAVRAVARQRVPAGRAVRPGVRRARHRDLDHAFAGDLTRACRVLGPRGPTANLPGVIRAARAARSRPGDQVQLTDPKGRQHRSSCSRAVRSTRTAARWRTTTSSAAPEGSVVPSSGGTRYVALRPLLADFTLSMTRGAAVVYPKDAAQIVAMADIFPGARVLEAGAGSGALSCWLLRAVGRGRAAGLLRAPARLRRDRPGERRAVLRRAAPGLAAGIGELTADGAVGAPPARPGRRRGPGTELTASLRPGGAGHAGAVGVRRHGRGAALIGGGLICCYVATTTQLSRTVEALREQGSFDEPAAWESLCAAGTSTGSRSGPSTG